MRRLHPLHRLFQTGRERYTGLGRERRFIVRYRKLRRSTVHNEAFTVEEEDVTSRDWLVDAVLDQAFTSSSAAPMFACPAPKNKTVCSLSLPFVTRRLPSIPATVTAAVP